MVVGEAINNIMSGIENTGGVKQHNHKKKLKQRFDIVRKLGQGTFGKVQLGINKETGQAVAIKTIKKSKIETEADLVRIRREIQIMSSVQHPNIIHIYEVFENKEKMVLVMEYAAGGELYDYLSERKILDEEEARRIFRQIATACYYCHKHKICHRDLKLENILLDIDNNAKIADFGLSNVFDDQRLLNTFCGSPLYASPEIVKGTPYNGPEVDCWSLGVLLYTLVYGAMPFDGSNFKRLVKQISQGDYFEPAKPSPASPLIRDMLTVSPKNRANIEKICTHWWVNENYDENCLEISEELANQTPVRLDLLLSLAPPPPQLESDKLVVTGDVDTNQKTETNANNAPARSQSAGSLMELSHPAERRIQELLTDEKAPGKRKLENTVSYDRVINEGAAKRADKIVKENTIADISVHAHQAAEDGGMAEQLPLDRSLTQTISRDMVEEGAACAEIIEEAKQVKPATKIKRNLSTLSSQVLEGINEIPSQENVASLNKENENSSPEKGVTKKKVKKKILADKNQEAEEKPAEEPTKPIERRRSRIFEAAEKFQNMITPQNEPKPAQLAEKPKRIVIPGVSVDGFKKEFERKASLTSTSPPKLKNAVSKKVLIDQAPPKAEPEAEKIPEKPADELKERVRNAVSIISSALDKEGARKSKSRPCCVRKPPVPFGASGRSASGNIGLLTASAPLGPKPFVRPNFDTKAEAKQVTDTPEPVEESQTSSAEITLKSATLPRRKTTKAEIQLNYPAPKPATMEFKTEMAHNVEAASVIMPVKSKERIIPIAFEEKAPTKPPPVAKVFQKQRSESLSRQSTLDSDTENVSGDPIKKSPREYIIPIAVEGGGYVTPRAGSLEPSEASSTASTVTNKRNKFGRARRMNSLLSDRDSEDESPFSNLHRHSSFGKESDTEEGGRKDAFHMHRLRSTRPRRTLLEHNDSLSSGEEDDDDGFETLTAEHLFSNLLSRVRDLTQKLNVEDGGRPGFPSSRLLSHFDRGTNFWNFPSRLDSLSRHSPIGRSLSRDRDRNTTDRATPWRRSVSRDLASDIESVFRENATPAATRPRGDKPPSTKENLNLSDLNLKKFQLTDEDALALSYLTPGLSRRIQKHLFSQIPPADIKKLQRTLSSCDQNPTNPPDSSRFSRRSVDRISSTLPRYTIDRDSDPPTTTKLRFPKKLLSPEENERSARASSFREPRSPESSYSESFSTDSSTRPSKFTNNNTNKTDLNKKPSTNSSPRRISRFLRPDFFDPPPKDDANALIKEKKEREIETQKVLKEIRDKRKFRLNSARERSLSREKSTENSQQETAVKETDLLLSNVSNNIKTIENNLPDYVNVPTTIPDYVNVKVEPVVVKKTRISKLARPKSYPTETQAVEPQANGVKEEKESKISRIRKGFTRQGANKNDKNDKNEANKHINEEEKGHKNKLLQSIEKKLEKFRNSASKDPDEAKAMKEKKSNVESAIKRLREQSLPRNLEHCTESGLIKRAVSVEDLTANKPLQASRKSVTKILGLFKKYEEQDGNKMKAKKKAKSETPEPCTKKLERPKSLLFDKKSAKDDKAKSKLPVNAFRRSLNLDNIPTNGVEPKKDKNANPIETKSDKNLNKNADSKPEKANLRLDLKARNSPVASTSSQRDENRNSVTTDDNSFLSPDDNDTWSVCSSNDLISPVSPNGHHYHNNLCSGDESNESVIDRIRRKSFYTRFNENKRPRRTSRDLLKDYSTLDRRSSYGASDYKPGAAASSLVRRTSYGSSLQEPKTRDYKAYTRSASLLNDYVNVPNRYQTYSSSKIAKPTIGAAYSDAEDVVLDELLSAAKSRRYNYPLQTSLANSRASVSPVSEQFYHRSPSSLNPTSSEPV